MGFTLLHHILNCVRMTLLSPFRPNGSNEIVMALTISGQAYDALFDVVQERSYYLEAEDPLDLIVPYPQELRSGQFRTIELRDGLNLAIACYQQFDDLAIYSSKQSDCVRLGFHLSGFHRDELAEVGTGEYALSGQGIVPKSVFHSLAIARADNHCDRPSPFNDSSR
jgi:hypothetical protein